MNARSPSVQLARAVRPHAADIAAVAAELVRHGWAEASAGNISARLEPGPLVTSLLVKRTGARMRDIARNPHQGLCLLSFGAGDRSYSVLPKDAKPSSELPTHAAVHDMLARFRPDDRVVVHTHPTALVALSLLYPEPRRLVELLLRMHTEAPVLLQDRMSAIQFLPPGSSSLGRATAAALEDASAVVWPGHGIVAVGPDAAAALDLIELTDKAAEIALRVGARLGPRTGLSPAQQKSIRKTAGLE